jgi:hypothetical protein
MMMKSKLFLAALSAMILTVGAVHAEPGDGRHRPPSFEDLDSDGDDLVSSDEFAAPAEERFVALDADGNDALSLDEFAAPASEKFGELDTDGDGFVSEEELRAGRPQRRPQGGNGE